MEKISGILPSSARVSSVDLKEAPPVRPGTPGFGRADGVSSLRESTPPQDTTRKAAGVQMDQLDWRAKDQMHAEVAKRVSEGFFIKNKRESEPVRDIDGENSARVFQNSVPSKPAGFKGSEFAPIRISEPMVEDDGADDVDFFQPMAERPAEQPEGLYPKGSFINRVA